MACIKLDTPSFWSHANLKWNNKELLIGVCSSFSDYYLKREKIVDKEQVCTFVPGGCSSWTNSACTAKRVWISRLVSSSIYFWRRFLLLLKRPRLHWPPSSFGHNKGKQISKRITKQNRHKPVTMVTYLYPLYPHRPPLPEL